MGYLKILEAFDAFLNSNEGDKSGNGSQTFIILHFVFLCDFFFDEGFDFLKHSGSKFKQFSLMIAIFLKIDERSIRNNIVKII